MTMRRVVLANVTSVALQCPLPFVGSAALRLLSRSKRQQEAAAKAKEGTEGDATATSAASIKKSATFGKQSSFALITDEERQWIREQSHISGKDRSMMMLSTRPTPSLMRGMLAGVYNVFVAATGTPVVWFAITLERIRTMPRPWGLLLGPFYAAAWSGIFLFAALYAALQQTLWAFYLKLYRIPMSYLTSRHVSLSEDNTTKGSSSGVSKKRHYAWQWCPLTGRYDVVRGMCGEPHPELADYESDTALREGAMARLAQRKQGYYKFDEGNGGNSTAKKYNTKRGGGGEEDYYVMLGVQRNASMREIKEAYNQLVLKLHPDRNPSPQAATQFDEVTKAYRVLVNPQKRRKYDLAGRSAVEDLGEMKREGVRALFGGMKLHPLIGDVLTSGFSHRVIDGLDYTTEELVVLQQRSYEWARDELLERYLAHYIDNNSNNKEKMSFSTTTTTTTGPFMMWDETLKVHLRSFLSTGLAREVLYVLGHEYRRTVEYFDAEQRNKAVQGTKDKEEEEEKKKDESTLRKTRRTRARLPVIAYRRLALYLTHTLPHRAQVLRHRLRAITKLRSRSLEDTNTMVDMVWYMCLRDLERVAAWTSFAVLYDQTLSADELRRRRDALGALAELFITQGQPYKGANKATAELLMNSLREYQQQRAREREEAARN